MNSALDKQASEACRRNCWFGAIVLGLVVFILFWAWIGWGGFPSLFLALVVTLVAGYGLVTRVCTSSAQSAASQPQNSNASTKTAAAAPAKPASDASVAAAPVVVKASEATAQPATVSSSAVPPVKTARPKAAAKAKAATKPKAKAKPKPTAKSKATAKKAKASDPKTTPTGLASPRGGKADDLKMVKGVGPGIEKSLNAMGVFHFDQIAAWGVKELAQADAAMPRFKGRAARDEWIAQAKKLAAGEETEFSARVKKGDVY